MKAFTFSYVLCAVFLLLAMFPMHPTYYCILRPVITLAAIAAIFIEIALQRRRWAFFFISTAFIFNPVLPVYLQNKNTWIIIDAAVLLLFILYFIFGKHEKKT